MASKSKAKCELPARSFDIFVRADRLYLRGEPRPWSATLRITLHINLVPLKDVVEVETNKVTVMGESACSSYRQLRILCAKSNRRNDDVCD